MSTAKLRIGDWNVDPEQGLMTRGGHTVRLEPRPLRILLCMAARPGGVVSADDLLREAWPGVVVTPDSVYQAIAGLRRLLGDDSKQGAYIATVPRQGYRLVAEVGAWQDAATADTAAAPPVALSASSAAPEVLPVPFPPPTRRRVWLAGAAALLVLAAGAGAYGALAPGNGRPQSIAVLPFLDFTEDMNHEIFADGMAEELIGKISKVPGFKVPPLSASFYFKGKEVPVAQVAQHLGVDYVVDGSVRRSGNTVRVAARLMRASSGFIVWSDAYDRPADDLLAVQDEVAGKVSKALVKALERRD